MCSRFSLCSERTAMSTEPRMIFAKVFCLSFLFELRALYDLAEHARLFGFGLLQRWKPERLRDKLKPLIALVYQLSARRKKPSWLCIYPDQTHSKANALCLQQCRCGSFLGFLSEPETTFPTSLQTNVMQVYPACERAGKGCHQTCAPQAKGLLMCSPPWPYKPLLPSQQPKITAATVHAGQETDHRNSRHIPGSQHFQHEQRTARKIVHMNFESWILF